MQTQTPDQILTLPGNWSAITVVPRSSARPPPVAARRPLSSQELQSTDQICFSFVPSNNALLQMINKPPALPISTLISHLHHCSHTHNLKRAHQIHSHLITTSLLSSSPQLTTSLISLYSALRLPLSSLSSFFSSPLPPNLFTFNALISSLSSNHLPSLSLRFFNLLRLDSPFSPDKFTFPCAVKACAALGLPAEAQKLHSHAVKLGLDSDKFVTSALVHAYLEFGLFEHALRLFDGLPERDVVLWNAMVNGFARKGDFKNALGYFAEMCGEGVRASAFTVTGILSAFTAMADIGKGRAVHGLVVKSGFEDRVSVCNALIDLYGKCHEVGDAVRVFDGTRERDLLTWNSMASAFQYNADHGETLRCFCRMRCAGMQPDAITLAAVLPACSQGADLMHGRLIHAFMVTSGMSCTNDVFVHNALMDMYAKSGALADAKQVFDRMLANDVASWNILIHGYSSHGLAPKALELFDAMCLARVAPDEITFVGLLSACSHAGLVEQGRDLFKQMEAEYGIVPVMEHYSCMVDLYGRAGRLKEAQEIAEQANEGGVWRAYLAACKMHGMTEQAAEAAERVVGLDPKASGAYVLLANAYGLAGRFEELEEVRGEMWRKRVSKVVGCSWLEVAGLGLHTFVTGDHGHPEAEGIYAALHALFIQTREFCWVPDIFVLGTDTEVDEALGIA